MSARVMVGCGGCGGKEATAAVVKVRPKGARGSFTRQRSMVVMMNNTIGLVEVERRWCVLSADSSEIMKCPLPEQKLVVVFYCT